MHRSGLKQSRLPVEVVRAAGRQLPAGWEYAVVRWTERTGEIAFIQVEDWDTAEEPTVGEMVVVRLDGSWRRYRPRPGSEQVYHHKWMLVGDGYPGFDVEASRARSEAWGRLGVDRRRIGLKRYWETEVLPRLKRVGAAETNEEEDGAGQ